MDEITMTDAQRQAEEQVRRHGFEFADSFRVPVHLPADLQTGKVLVLTRNNRHELRQVEIDPDGKINGTPWQDWTFQ